MYFNEERIKQIMKSNNLDVLITTAPVNVSYFTGFPLPHGCMADVQAWAIVPYGKTIKPILIAPVNAIDMVLEHCYMDKVMTWGKFYFYEKENMDWKNAPDEEKELKRLLDVGIIADDALTAVLVTLKNLGLDKSRIGLDERDMIIPSSLEQFSQKLPGAEVFPARFLISMIRSVKTEDEIILLKQAAAINEKGVQALLDFGMAGKTEKELHQVYLKTIRDAGAESHHACIQSGRRAALPAGEPSGNVLKYGQSMRLDFDLVYNRYFSDMARTASIGKPDIDAVRFSNATIAGIKKCQELLKPGIKVSDVFNSAIEEIRKNGIQDFKRHHIGHGIGLACYDFPLISPANNQLIEENMVINIETPYYLIGYGASHFENTFLITKDGCECLQKMKLELKVLDNK